MTPAQESAAAQALASLEADLAAAWIQVLSTTPTWGSGNVKDAVLKNLEADRTRIGQLGSSLLNQVRAGSLGWDRWVKIAEATHQDIAYQAGLSGEWALSGVLWSTVTETTSDLTEIVQSPWTKMIGLTVLGLVALHYLSPLIGGRR